MHESLKEGFNRVGGATRQEAIQVAMQYALSQVEAFVHAAQMYEGWGDTLSLQIHAPQNRENAQKWLLALRVAERIGDWSEVKNLLIGNGLSVAKVEGAAKGRVSLTEQTPSKAKPYLVLAASLP